MRADPLVRADGLCACGCGQRVKSERWQRYARGVKDPFASTECARRWHGLPSLEAEGLERQREGGRTGGRRHGVAA